MLLIHGRDIIEPIEIGQRLKVSLVFDQLLGAAMKKTDVRIDPRDNFSIELEYEPQYAMRRRMLWPKVQREIARTRLGHRDLM